MSAEITVPTDHQYLRPEQVDELRSESATLQAKLTDPRGTDGADRSLLSRRKRSTDAMLKTQTPPETTGTQRDVLARRARELEEKFVPGMLSAEVMRKNPTGSVDRNLHWHGKHSLEVSEWKNIQRILHRGSDDKNAANIERLRPHRRPTDPSMHDAQIPGAAYSFPSEQFQANYDATFGEAEPEPVTAEGEVPATEGAKHPATHKRPAKKGGKTGKKRAAAKPVPMLCGVLKSSRGKHFHERACDECQRIKTELEHAA